MVTGLFLGFMVWLGAVFSWTHLPMWLKRLSIRWFIATDLLFTVLTWITVSRISNSLGAVIATITAGLLMNFTMLFLAWVPQVRDHVLGNKHDTTRS